MIFAAPHQLWKLLQQSKMARHYLVQLCTTWQLGDTSQVRIVRRMDVAGNRQGGMCMTACETFLSCLVRFVLETPTAKDTAFSDIPEARSFTASAKSQDSWL